MTAPRLTFIPDLLELHFEELQFLWARRRAALRSPQQTARTLAALDERIEAHTQGMLVVGAKMLPLVEPSLVEGGPDAAFAAAYALLRAGDPALAARVVDAVPNAAPKARRGLAEALRHAHNPAVHAPLAALARAGDPACVALALEVFAFRGALQAEAVGPTLDALLAHDDGAVRAAAWRVATYLCAPVDPKHYSAALGDDPPGLRVAALEAAAWARVPGVVAYARAAAERPAPETLDALRLLAILGGPEDARRVAAVARVPELGPARFACAGASGSPALVELLLAEMAGEDAATAVAAGATFAKLTGHDVTSTRTAEVTVDEDLTDTVALPDPERARAVWGKLAPALAGAERICGGIDVARPIDADAATRMDMESRWDLFLRARYLNTWHGLPAQLEVLASRA